eukprot:TRINITY_DN6083_c0_g1_i7.p1 TRINITY_DN6083_c0_g1~~TRINITY_DN6083_c0_g1_i7.p1  ORF type:complete len:120 (-),score=17.91 TRINITY_DN6083_c0_g1_i7:373-732(-)
MAPEVLQRRDLDKSCDIWSLGITIIEMADCYPPFMELQTERQVKRQICNPQTKYMIKSFDAPILMKDFLYACLTYLPNGRPTCQNVNSSSLFISIMILTAFSPPFSFFPFLEAPTTSIC